MSAEALRGQTGSPCWDLLLSMAPQGHPGLTCQIRAAKMAQAHDFLLFPSTALAWFAQPQPITLIGKWNPDRQLRSPTLSALLLLETWQRPVSLLSL